MATSNTGMLAPVPATSHRRIISRDITINIVRVIAHLLLFLLLFLYGHVANPRRCKYKDGDQHSEILILLPVLYSLEDRTM